MKEAVKKIIAGRLIQLERMLDIVEQDMCNDDLPSGALKFTIEGRDELLAEYVEVKKCFYWVNDLKDD